VTPDILLASTTAPPCRGRGLALGASGLSDGVSLLDEPFFPFFPKVSLGLSIISVLPPSFLLPSFGFTVLLFSPTSRARALRRSGGSSFQAMGTFAVRELWLLLPNRVCCVPFPSEGGGRSFFRAVAGCVSGLGSVPFPFRKVDSFYLFSSPRGPDASPPPPPPRPKMVSGPR